MRRRIKRSSLFTMIAVVALLSLGIGYAAWSQDLTVSGSVTTANFDVYFNNATASKATPDKAGTCSLVPSDPAYNLVWSVSGASPGLGCSFTFTVVNAGGVDVRGEVTEGPTNPADWHDNKDLNCGTGDLFNIPAGKSVTCTFSGYVESDALPANNSDSNTALNLNKGSMTLTYTSTQ